MSNAPSFLSIQGVSNLPDFVKNDHKKFTEFVKSYYEWLEENSFKKLDNFCLENDVSIASEKSLEHYYEMFLSGFPKYPIIDKSLLIKNVFRIYQSKGSEEAFRLFFLSIYNTDIEFYYPKQDILRSSAGKYQKLVSIRIHYDENFLGISGEIVTGKNNNSTAVVERITSYFIGKYRIIELFLQDIDGNFSINETIYNINLEESIIYGIVDNISIENGGSGYVVGEKIDIIDEELSKVSTTLIDASSTINTTDETIKNFSGGIEASGEIIRVSNGVVDSISIENGGSGYVVGDELIFEEIITANTAIARVSSVNGSGAITGIALYSKGFNYSKLPSITVSSVNGSGAILLSESSSIGSILEIGISNFGVNYENIPEYEILTENGSGASLNISIGTIGRYSGRWLNNDGFLNDKKFLIDSFYYQDYSYVLKSPLLVGEYKETVLSLLHPAGMQFFGEEILREDILLGNNLYIEPQLTDTYYLTIPLGNFLRWNENTFGISDSNVPSLGMTYQYFDLYKYQYVVGNRIESELYHFHAIRLENFNETEKFASFDFMPDPLIRDNS